eukprot:758743-Hanusia_phi.AAC.4
MFPFLKGLVDPDEDRLKEVLEEKESLLKQVENLNAKLQNVTSHVSSGNSSGDALQKFINTANIPVCGFNQDMHIVQFNAKAEEIMKIKKNRVLGEHILEAFAIDPTCKEHLRTLCKDALEGKKTHDFEFSTLTGDGEEIDLLINFSTMTGEHDEIVEVLGIAQDITARKRLQIQMERATEDAKRLVEEKEMVARQWEAFIQTATAPIIGIDSNGNISHWNDKAAELTGFDTIEVLGKPLFDGYVKQTSRTSVKIVFTNALHGIVSGNFECPLQSKGGNCLDLLLNCTPHRDMSGNVIGVIAVGQDITERKKVEQEKSRVVQELQSFIDSANAPIFGIDAEGYLNEWNNKAAQITGFSRDDVLGCNFVEDLIDGAYHNSLQSVLDDALRGKETVNFEFPFYTQKNRKLNLLLNVTARKDINGDIIGVIGVAQDVTDRTVAEQEKIRVAQELQSFIDTANAPIFGIDANGL